MDPYVIQHKKINQKQTILLKLLIHIKVDHIPNFRRCGGPSNVYGAPRLSPDCRCQGKEGLGSLISTYPILLF